MTRALSNTDFADRMRECRGEAPRRIMTYRMLVWAPYHTSRPDWAIDYTGKFGGLHGLYRLMTPCYSMGRQPFDTLRRALVHVDDILGSEIVEDRVAGPDIWHITFKPGDKPEGW